jgi:hypothetical protein
LHLEVLRRLNAAVRQAASEPETNRKETGGILLGRYKGAVTEIIDFQAVPCEYAAGSEYALSTLADQTGFEKALENAGPAAVGYYRTQTRGQNSLTDDDLAIINRYFNAPGNVHLVIGPTDEGPSMAGIFFRDDGIVCPVSFMEFPCDSPIPRVRRPSPVPRIEEHRIARSGPIPPERPLPRFAAPPDSQKQPAGGFRRTFSLAGAAVIILVLCASLALLGYVLGRRTELADRPDDSPSPAVTLHIEKQGDDLRVSWEKSAPVLRDATAGRLIILDGDRPRQAVSLNAEELRTGSVLYTPATANVQFQLEIARADGPSTSESVLVLRPPATALQSSTPTARPVRTEPVPSRDPAVERTEQAQSISTSQVKPVARLFQPPQSRGQSSLIILDPPAIAHNTATPSVPGTPRPTVTLQIQAPPPAPETSAPKPNTAAAQPPLRQTSIDYNYVGPRVIRQANPQIPRQMWSLIGAGTTVQLKVSIDENGQVTSAEPVSGPDYLVIHARTALARWAFEPATLNGKKVPGSTVVVFQFRPQR